MCKMKTAKLEYVEENDLFWRNLANLENFVLIEKRQCYKTIIPVGNLLSIFKFSNVCLR